MVGFSLVGDSASSSLFSLEFESKLKLPKAG